MTEPDLNALFQTAVDDDGKAFLDAEKTLLAAGEPAKQLLRAKQADTSLTPFARFVAKTLADGIEGTGKTFQDAMAAVADMEARAAASPLGKPTADTVAGTLAAHSEKLSDLVALHLIKELGRPDWQTFAAIIYLRYYAGVSALPAFDQFKADLAAGKRGLSAADLKALCDPYFSDLEQAMAQQRAVSEDEDFKSNIAKAASLSGAEKEKAESDAVASALARLIADPDHAQKLRDAEADLSDLLIQPLLKATHDAVDEHTVRKILAEHLLGGAGKANEDEQSS